MNAKTQKQDQGRPRRLTTMPLMLVGLVLISCSNSPPPPDDVACDLDGIHVPDSGCGDADGEGDFRGVCSIDCLGNVVAHQRGNLGPLPGNRFYAVLFERRWGDLPPIKIDGYRGSVNLDSSGAIEDIFGSRADVSRKVQQDGSILVQFDEPFVDSTQLAVVVQFPGGKGWTFRTYVGGVP